MYAASKEMAVPTLRLLNGKTMPILGLGCMAWQKDPSETEKAIEHAIDLGYRHFDTAYAYLNEKQVGNAIRRKIAEGKVKREDIYLTTKLHAQFMRPENVAKGFNRSLTALELDYIDMYLIHVPIAMKLVENDPNPFPTDEKGVPLIDVVDPLETWKEMEKLYKSGKVKGIGLSNFNSKQIQRIWDNSEVKPMNLQIECNAFLPQYELVEWCQNKGIAVTAWSPLGAPWRSTTVGTPFDNKDAGKVIEHPTVVSLAKKYDKSPAQLLLRWLTQRDVCPIPKSTNPGRLQENFSIFDFKLDDADMKSMNLGVNIRMEGMLTKVKDHPYYPFNEPF